MFEELDDKFNVTPTTTQHTSPVVTKKAIEDDAEEETGGSRRLTRGKTNMKETTERLRVGDRIEYYTQTGVAGDSRNRCEAEILYIDPKAEKPLMGPKCSFMIDIPAPTFLSINGACTVIVFKEGANPKPDHCWRPMAVIPIRFIDPA